MTSTIDSFDAALGDLLLPSPLSSFLAERDVHATVSELKRATRHFFDPDDESPYDYTIVDLLHLSPSTAVARYLVTTFAKRPGATWIFLADLFASLLARERYPLFIATGYDFDTIVKLAYDSDVLLLALSRALLTLTDADGNLTLPDAAVSALSQSPTFTGALLLAILEGDVLPRLRVSDSSLHSLLSTSPAYLAAFCDLDVRQFYSVLATLSYDTPDDVILALATTSHRLDAILDRRQSAAFGRFRNAQAFTIHPTSRWRLRDTSGVPIFPSEAQVLRLLQFFPRGVLSSTVTADSDRIVHLLKPYPSPAFIAATTARVAAEGAITPREIVANAPDLLRDLGAGSTPRWFLTRLLLRVPGLAAYLLSERPLDVLSVLSHEPAYLALIARLAGDRLLDVAVLLTNPAVTLAEALSAATALSHA